MDGNPFKQRSWSRTPDGLWPRDVDIYTVLLIAHRLSTLKSLSWDPTLFDLDGYQSPVAGQDSSALEEAFDIHHQVFEQVFPEEVEQNRSFLSSIRPDLQEQLLRDIDVGVDLVGRSLDHGFRALNDSISAKFDALNSMILQGPPRAAAPPPRAPSPASPPSPPSPQSPPSVRAQRPRAWKSWRETWLWHSGLTILRGVPQRISCPLSSGLSSSGSWMSCK
ncbi:hypothetical protein KUCAC02_033617 [Chaenocephalus aceratus]|nr:hypothetical protein KUCAC02_033617 [Chaenocephalus aceratus]